MAAALQAMLSVCMRMDIPTMLAFPASLTDAPLHRLSCSSCQSLHLEGTSTGATGGASGSWRLRSKRRTSLLPLAAQHPLLAHLAAALQAGRASQALPSTRLLQLFRPCLCPV